MAMGTIRAAYGVPAKRGMRIEYRGYRGTVSGVITGSRGHRLRVRFDGDKFSHVMHPSEEGLTYLSLSQDCCREDK